MNNFVKEKCVYCYRQLDKKNTTKDHIPPRCIFPKPLGNVNLITVPCCKSCNSEYGHTFDEKFKILLAERLIINPSYSTNTAAKKFIASCSKTLKSNHRLKHQTENKIHYLNRVKYIPVIHLPPKERMVFRKMIKRVVKGLYYEINKKHLPKKINISVFDLNTCSNIFSEIKVTPIKYTVSPESFSVFYRFVDDYEGCGIWELYFYNSVKVYCVTFSKNIPIINI